MKPEILDGATQDGKGLYTEPGSSRVKARLQRELMTPFGASSDCFSLGLILLTVICMWSVPSKA